VDGANRFRPAQAGAHRSDEIVVAHEKLVVMYIVDVVGVYDTTFVSASEWEALVGRAHVSTAGVESTELGLGQSGARVTTIAGADLDVTSALLLGTEQTSTRSFTSAGLGAGTPWGPVGYNAVLGARLLVALGVLDQLSTGLAAVVLRVDNGAATPHLASAACFVAASEGTPVAEFAVHGAGNSLALLLRAEGGASLATESGASGDLAIASAFALAASSTAFAEGGPLADTAVGWACMFVAVSGVAELGAGFAVASVGGNDDTPRRLLAAATGGTALSVLGPFADFAVVALLGGSRSGSRSQRVGNVGQFNGRNVESFE